jgi:hypothetical protein
MTSTVKNLSRRLVSFCGNSGQSWHLAPGASLEVPDVEVTGNVKIAKLSAQRVVAVAAGARTKPEAGGEEGERGKRARSGR